MAAHRTGVLVQEYRWVLRSHPEAVALTHHQRHRVFQSQQPLCRRRCFQVRKKERLLLLPRVEQEEQALRRQVL